MKKGRVQPVDRTEFLQAQSHVNKQLAELNARLSSNIRIVKDTDRYEGSAECKASGAEKIAEVGFAQSRVTGRNMAVATPRGLGMPSAGSIAPTAPVHDAIGGLRSRVTDVGDLVSVLYDRLQVIMDIAPPAVQSGPQAGQPYNNSVSQLVHDETVRVVCIREKLSEILGRLAV